MRENTIPLIIKLILYTKLMEKLRFWMEHSNMLQFVLRKEN